MPKINQEEYEVLKGLDNRWKWIARDDENQIYSAELYVFERKPEQEDGYWNNISNGEYALLEERDDPFQFIQWEDEEPYEIAELIREYEIKELRLAPSGTVIVDSFDESEETEVKDIEELKSWFEDDKLYVGEYVKHKINQLDEPEVLSQELPVIPKYVVEYLEFAKSDVPLKRVMEIANTRDEWPKWRKEYDWISANDETFARAWLDGYEVEEEPLYHALIKGHGLVRNSAKYWIYDKQSPEDVFIGHRIQMYARFKECLSKSEWNKLGINDSNADFVKVGE